MKGVALIAKERAEQLYEHNYTIEGDTLNNGYGELKDAAMYCLTAEDGFYPVTWDKNYKESLRQKSALKSLIIAGAFIAAEIDRILADENRDSHV